MKHIALKLSIFSMILLSTFLWSCKEEQSNIFQANNTNVLNNYLHPCMGFLDSTGIIHNEILDHLNSNLSEHFDLCNYSHFNNLLTLSSSYLQNNYNLASQSVNISDSLKDNIENNCDSFDDLTYAVNDLAISSLNSSTISNIVSSYEKNLTINALNYLRDSTNFSDCADAFEALNKIQNYADSVIILINNMTVVDSIDKSLGLGTLNIIKSSASYWSNYIEVESSIQMKITPKNEIQIFGVIAAYLVVKVSHTVCADAGGFISAWAGAVAEEIYENGSLNRANEKKRIGAGINGAAVGSTAAAFNLI